jgi:transcriptional regulator with XRE-family HTH domain
MDYGRAIKTLRTLRQHTQGSLAREMETSGEYISVWERGIRSPPLHRLEAMATILSIPLHLFFLLAADTQRELGTMTVEEADAFVTRAIREWDERTGYKPRSRKPSHRVR